ncbi:MAG: GYD domain-containing protein [Halobacteriota archaeon]
MCGGGYTPTYILLSTLTAEGRKTVGQRPNRIQEVDREMEAMQVKIISQHAVVGPYDFVNIVEAPDNETILRASVELGARGTVKIVSMPAIPIEEFIKAIKER